MPFDFEVELSVTDDRAAMAVGALSLVDPRRTGSRVEAWYSAMGSKSRTPLHRKTDLALDFKTVFSCHEQQRSTQEAPVTDHYVARIRKVIEHVLQNLNQPPSLEDAARIACFFSVSLPPCLQVHRR